MKTLKEINHEFFDYYSDKAKEADENAAAFTFKGDDLTTELWHSYSASYEKLANKYQGRL